MFSLFTLSMWYTVVNPHLWLCTCVLALLSNDLLFPYRLSVENFHFNCLTPNFLSALYVLLIWSIAYLVNLCNVSFRVALALSIPIPDRSSRTSADILECLSVKGYVCLVGISSSALSNLVVLAIVLGIVAINFSLNPGSCIWPQVEYANPSDTLDGFH